MFVIGKKVTKGLKSDEELAVKQTVSNANFSHSMVYDRLLKDGVLYTSTSYQRQAATCDYVMYFEDGSVGFAMKYLSICCADCAPCQSPCNHLVIAEVLQDKSCVFTDDPVTGATAQHIHCIDDSR